MSDVLIAPGASPSMSSRKVSPKRYASALKLCFISETLHAGVGRHIVDTVSALADRGHEIHVLYSPIRLDPKLLAQLAERPGVVCRAIPMPRAIGWSDVAAFRQIAAYVRANGPFDVVHGHSAKGGGYARLLRLFGNRSVFYSPHAFITSSPTIGVTKRLTYRMIETLFATLTDRVVCCSDDERSQARQLGFAPDRLSLVVHGMAPPDTAPREIVREQLGISPRQTVIGFVGRMEDQKAPERLIAAARRLLPENPNLVVLMIGDGSKRGPLESSLRQAGLGDRVRWLGAVDAQRYLPAMDVFVVCSLYEGFAYVMLEALFAGLPIVSTPVGGTRESVIDGINGIVVRHDDPAQLADAIRALATDGTLRRSMARAARDHSERFTVPRMIDALETLYFAELERASAPRRTESLATSDVASVP